jgi:uncharacterized protein YeaO (DUF488 family)
MMTTSAQKSSPATERDSPSMNPATHNLRASAIRLKRAYEPADDRDGTRVLVDRLWPRGVSKDTAHLNAWMKDLGPSDELRTWFGHRSDRWNSFQQRYQQELRAPLRQLLLAELQSVARRSTLTLVYGARDTSENEAVVIRDYLLGNHPVSDQSWDDARSLLAAVGVVAAAHAAAQATTSTLRLFVTPHLTDRKLETALQALQADGMVRESSDGWQLTSQATKQVRQLSDAV